MDKYYYDAASVKEACCSKIKEIITDVYPGIKIKGAEGRIGSVDGEPGSSMSISLAPTKFGAFYDHASDDKGDLLNILEHTKGLTYSQAIEWLGENYTTCIKRKFEPNKKKERTPLKETEEYTDISPLILEYAQSVRGIEEHVLKTYTVKSLKHDESIVCFLSCDSEKQVSKVEYCDTKEKRYWSSTNCEHNLFGKPACDPSSLKGTLIITEGRWDALSYAQIGKPAVSIPSGVKNNQWIDADWEYLQQFHTIYISFDMDKAGQDTITEVVKRLGIHKCKIISLPEKDASEMLQQGRSEELYTCIEKATIPDSGSMISATSLKEQTFEILENGVENTGDEYFLPDFDIRIRPHEMTLIFGLSFHGKSQFVSNQVAYDASQHRQTAIASFEQISVLTMSSLLKQFANKGDITENREEFDKAYDALAPFITIYDTVERTNPQKIIDDFTYAHKRKGIDRFVIDNVMSLDTNRDDNSEQANAAHLFREFTKKYPIHLFVVAHPRKPGQESGDKQPVQNDIRGAGEWGDIPENIILVWRNLKKQEDIENMKLDKRSIEEINNYNRAIPDGKIIVRKQRVGGATPLKNVWFFSDTQRFSIDTYAPPDFPSVDNNNNEPF